MKDLLRSGYVCHPQQLYSVRRLSFTEGRAKGASLIEVNTADGLAVDILPDSGLDIGQVRFRGINMTYISKNGYDGPAVFSPHDTEFMNTFPGGLMHTCGLRNAGPANRDNGEWMTMHGRYHGIPAEQVSAREEGEDIVISGIVRESALFGHVLVVRREIRIPCRGTQIHVHDIITNETPRDEEIMLLYHCNFGYPLLSETAELIFPEKRETIPRTPFAEAGLDRPADLTSRFPGRRRGATSRRWRRSFTPSLKTLESVPR